MTAVTMSRYQAGRSHKDSFKKNNNSSQREFRRPVAIIIMKSASSAKTQTGDV